jgi:hypothetical protein
MTYGRGLKELIRFYGVFFILDVMENSSPRKNLSFFLLKNK